MNYIFTAAGEGSRFIKKGIKPPKPLIKVLGDELLIWSMRSFPLKKDDNVYIISQKAHRCKEKIAYKLDRLFPNININWLEIEYLTNGQLITSMIAVRKFKLEGNILIHNCDSAFQIDLYELKNLLNDLKNNYAFFPVFEADGDNWSFAETELNTDKIIKITEKERISNNCSIGTYIFRSASEFLQDANKYIKEIKPDENLGEYYIAPFLNYVCSKGKEIKITFAKNTKLFGTLDQLLDTFKVSFYDLIAENACFANQRKTLVVDIDGTLCSSNINGDYSKCKPIESVVEKIRIENEKGTYIILIVHSIIIIMYWVLTIKE